MRIGILLAKKGYEEGGSPIGGVIINNQARRIHQLFTDRIVIAAVKTAVPGNDRI